MIGQKIVESLSIDESWDGKSVPQPLTGLTVRRTKSVGLRIVTEPPTPSDNLVQDPTTERLSDRRSSYISVITPDSSHTFGCPNPTMVSLNKDKISASGSPSSPRPPRSPSYMKARRSSRYSEAENALKSAVAQSSSERTSQELQIRALEHVTALLSQQASDAQACVVKLRASIAGSELAPDELRQLHRERWLEERRSVACGRQSKMTHDLLARLSTTSDNAPFNHTQPLSSKSRREMNLARFFERSPTRTPSPWRSSAPATYYHVPDRRKTISSVRTMHLRPSALTLALQRPMQLHRSISLDGSDVPLRSPLQAHRDLRALASPQEKLAESPVSPTGRWQGYATIHRSAVPRSRAELVAQLDDVALPDYALRLLEKFSASSTDVSLRPAGASTRPRGHGRPPVHNPVYNPPPLRRQHSAPLSLPNPSVRHSTKSSRHLPQLAVLICAPPAFVPIDDFMVHTPVAEDRSHASFSVYTRTRCAPVDDDCRRHSMPSLKCRGGFFARLKRRIAALGRR
ncbi:hypothetical protein A0H81_04604 [Grifola frondosa]|uniref:Uncharacterized protein n=1 Tax=Grifola frondosa TaxID=5627 RepID=A0A1C7MFS5_GRIFR|nr:hypothetical protein A0H81_04604 [Grifola frondosa]